jgi:hypothetical protein
MTWSWARLRPWLLVCGVESTRAEALACGRAFHVAAVGPTEGEAVAGAGAVLLLLREDASDIRVVLSDSGGRSRRVPFHAERLEDSSDRWVLWVRYRGARDVLTLRVSGAFMPLGDASTTQFEEEFSWPVLEALPEPRPLRIQGVRPATDWCLGQTVTFLGTSGRDPAFKVVWRYPTAGVEQRFEYFCTADPRNGTAITAGESLECPLPSYVKDGWPIGDVRFQFGTLPWVEIRPWFGDGSEGTPTVGRLGEPPFDWEVPEFKAAPP